MYSLSTLIFAVATSFLGSLACAYFFFYRKKSINKSIVSIDSEIEFLEKIQKGNVELLRSTFIAILFSLTLVFGSTAVAIFAWSMDMPEGFSRFVFSITVGMWGLASLVCFTQFRSLIRLKDVKESKNKLVERKVKLQKKLENV